jgi:hypothetical protein
LKKLAFIAGLAVSLCASEWIERKNSDEIVIYTQKTSASKIDKFKGVAIVHAPVEKILPFIDNPKKCGEWIKYCKSGELLENLGGGATVTRTITNMPWPLTNRDTIAKNVKTVQNGVVEIKFSSASSRFPEDSSLVRIKLLDGYWKLRPITSQATEVTYEVLSDPGNLPAWMVNMGVVDQPFETLLNLKTKTER